MMLLWPNKRLLSRAEQDAESEVNDLRKETYVDLSGGRGTGMGHSDPGSAKDGNSDERERVVTAGDKQHGQGSFGTQQLL